MSIELGIKELRSLTSARLRELSPDDEIVVTDRGQPIATIRPVRALTAKEQFLADLDNTPVIDTGAMEELMEMKERSIAAQRTRD